MIRTFRYPLRPTPSQEAMLDAWLEQCCDIYNAALQERRDAWRKQRISIGYNDQTKSLTEWRRSDPDGAAVPVRIQRSPLMRVDNAFKAFFRRVKMKDTPGFPRFRSRHRYDSFTIPGDPAVFKIDGDRVSLPKLSGVKVHLYRPIQGRVLTVTVRREPTGKWAICIACDMGAAPAIVEPRAVVGIDVGLKALAVTSDGEVIDNPRHAAKAAEKLARIQRTMARRKRGSRSRERARLATARAHERIRNQRLDHARKVAAMLVGRYDVLVHEDLNIRAMMRGLFAKQMNDAGWRILLHAIACKAESAGKLVVAVDPRGTSQRCSGCGAVVPKDLSVRVHDCPSCGLVMDRDENAAINIRALGRSAVSEAMALASPQARRRPPPKERALLPESSAS